MSASDIVLSACNFYEGSGMSISNDSKTTPVPVLVELPKSNHIYVLLLETQQSTSARFAGDIDNIMAIRESIEAGC